MVTIPTLSTGNDLNRIFSVAITILSTRRPDVIPDPMGQSSAINAGVESVPGASTVVSDTIVPF